MAISVKNKIGNKAKKKLTRFAVTQILPVFLIMILVVTLVIIILEIPSMVGEAIEEYFSDLFDQGAYENMPLQDLRDFFETNPELGGLEDLQSPIMLAKYIDLQLAGTIHSVESETITKSYKNGNYIGETITPYKLNYDSAVNIYSLPWQLMAATDIVNNNFGVTEYSDEVLLLHESLRPRFEGNISDNYLPTIFITHFIEKDISETTSITTYKEVEVKNPLTKEIEILKSPSTTETVKSWTERTEIKIPSTLFSSVDYYSAMYEYEITYSDSKPSTFTSTDVITNGDTSVVREISTTKIIRTPEIDDSTIQVKNTYTRDALSLVVPYNSRDLFTELIKGYPYTYNTQIAVANAFRSSGVYITDDYGPIEHNFVYPRLLRSSNTDNYYRTDIINLAKSLIGLDYFWGGKYNKIGFSGDWGSLTKCTSPGTSMTGLNLRSGLDCSGFVQWVYLNAGLTLESGTSTMLSGGKLTEVSLGELEPGDIGFYHDYSNGETGNHVGIYLGYIDGKYLFINAKGAPGARDDIHTTGQVLVTALYQDHNGFPPATFKKFYKYNEAVLQ